MQTIEAKLTGLLGIDPLHGETIQGQRYAVGQQFKPHHDFFYRDQPYWPEMEKSGGQRTWTAMIFLNEPEGGGQTAFPKASVKVTPRTGNLLAWNNLDAIGEPNISRSTRACRSSPAPNISSPNGTASGPGAIPASPPIERAPLRTAPLS